MMTKENMPFGRDEIYTIIKFMGGGGEIFI